MPFYLYRKFKKNNQESFELQRAISLAGYNLFYELWEKKGKPINKGWHANLDELVHEATEGGGNRNNHTIIIDLTPSRKNEINLVELLDVWAYTYGYEGQANWTPLMIKMRDIFYPWNDKLLTQEKHREIIQNFSNPQYGEDIFEFLYLGGEDRGWNFGIGKINAALIHKPAREFFRKYF